MCSAAHRANAGDCCTATQRRDLTWILEKIRLYLIQKDQTATVCLIWHSSITLKTECGIATRTTNKSGLISIPQTTRIFKSSATPAEDKPQKT